MAEKFAIYFGEPLALVSAGYEQARSARVNAIAADWLEMIAAASPTLSAQEWLTIVDVCDAVGIDRNMKLWAEVAEQGHEELAAKLRKLDRISTLATLEIAARITLNLGAHDDADALKLAGAKVSVEEA